MIYLDHNATTPVHPEVREAMLPYLGDRFGNASCRHPKGTEARRAVEHARERIASFVGCGPEELVFTSGGTESNNLAIKGVALARRDRGDHIIMSAVEHPSVREAALSLDKLGFRTTFVPVDGAGVVDTEALRAQIGPKTILVSVMHAQNEVGTIQFVDEVAEVIRGRGLVLHVDAAQSVGKVPVAVPFFGADLLTIAGHKLYGPKGVGALVVRRGLVLEPLFHGAGHERGRRSGTENVAGVVGLGKAIELARRDMAEAGERQVALRDYLHARLVAELPGIRLNGHRLYRLPNTLNVSFLGVSGATLSERLPGVCVATGPACHDGKTEVTPAFKAMGIGPERAGSSLRLSLGRTTTFDEMEQVAALLRDAVRDLRAAAEWHEAPGAAGEQDPGPACPRCGGSLEIVREDALSRVSLACVSKSTRCAYERIVHAVLPPGAGESGELA